ASSWKASIRMYSSGSSVFRDQSKKMQPGSSRVRWVNSSTSSRKFSTYSGSGRNRTLIRIMVSRVPTDRRVDCDLLHKEAVMAAQETFDFDVARWFTSPPLELEKLRGKVLLVEFFQMLCPGCVNHSLPQARRVHQMIKGDQLVVLGIHSVFEHHAVTGPDALEVFLHEFGIRFPVAVDRPSETGVLPVTMK